MAKVKLFGIYSTKIENNDLTIEAKDIEELLFKLAELEPNLDIKKLKRSIIFINNISITELNMFKTKIDYNDNISILSPAAGG